MYFYIMYSILHIVDLGYLRSNQLTITGTIFYRKKLYHVKVSGFSLIEGFITLRNYFEKGNVRFYRVVTETEYNYDATQAKCNL